MHRILSTSLRIETTGKHSRSRCSSAFICGFTTLLAALFSGCPGPTGIQGRITMRSGQAGNVQGCLVRLYANPDLSGIPVRETTSTLGDSLAAKSEFEITGLPTGSYYVLSWKDYSHDALIDNLDLIGVHGDTYSRGHGGTPVVVREGQISDSADVEMGVFHELVLTITPTRRADTLDFVYSLNNTCNLDTWLLYTPWGARIEDGSQKGAKLAGTLYHAPVIGVQGQPPPGGQYAVLATGTWLLGNFRDSVVKDVGTVK